MACLDRSFLLLVLSGIATTGTGCDEVERYSRLPARAVMLTDGGASQADGARGGRDASGDGSHLPQASGGAAAFDPDAGSSGGSSAGGVIGSGGVPATGGQPDTGGRAGTGGASAAGGATGSGGQPGSGGVTDSSGGSAGVGGAGLGGSGVTDPKRDPDLVLWYSFDEGLGTVVEDGSSSARNAALAQVGAGSAAFTTVHRVGTGAADLSSSSASAGGYVKLPASLQELGATGALSITCWVNIRTARAWQRVFDFGSDTTTYAHFTTSTTETDPPSPRFQITTAGYRHGQEINLTTPASLAIGVWHHVAVVLGPGATYTGTLYIDKIAVGQNTSMTLRPTDLGKTANNWIGRSQFSSDPLFDGQIDDFRIYKRALTADEIDALP